MMAINKWPNRIMINIIYKGTIRYLSILTFNRARTKGNTFAQDHIIKIFYLLLYVVCLEIERGDEIKGQTFPSVHFNIEQSVKNSAYIHNLS